MGRGPASGRIRHHHGSGSASQCTTSHFNYVVDVANASHYRFRTTQNRYSSRFSSSHAGDVEDGDIFYTLAASRPDRAGDLACATTSPGTPAAILTRSFVKPERLIEHASDEPFRLYNFSPPCRYLPHVKQEKKIFGDFCKSSRDS